MKKYTHAWIAFKAMERLNNAQLSPEDRDYANFLIDWFGDHKDGVITGAWYPDEVIVDNGTSHIMKYVPRNGDSTVPFGALPAGSLLQKIGKKSPLMNKAFSIDPKYNLPERCEALSHSVIDNFKIQQHEDKGSALAPTDHHVALLLFMLTHYIADAHMPLHCDARPGEVSGFDLHDAIEQSWENEVVKIYKIDIGNQRFIYEDNGQPLRVDLPFYATSILKTVDDELAKRDFNVDYGKGSSDVLDYMYTVSRYSFLHSYTYLPSGFKPAQLDQTTLQLTDGSGLTFREMSLNSLSDAVDAVARVWLHVVRRFIKWERSA